MKKKKRKTYLMNILLLYSEMYTKTLCSYLLLHPMEWVWYYYKVYIYIEAEKKIIITASCKFIHAFHIFQVKKALVNALNKYS
jgi:hypothetical protein